MLNFLFNKPKNKKSLTDFEADIQVNSSKIEEEVIKAFNEATNQVYKGKLRQVINFELLKFVKGDEWVRQYEEFKSISELHRGLDGTKTYWCTIELGKKYLKDKMQEISQRFSELDLEFTEANPCFFRVDVLEEELTLESVADKIADIAIQQIGDFNEI